MTLGAGTSIMMLPEGTRSRTGELRTLKPGAFELALQTGRPLLPIAVDGSAQALPKRGFILRGRSDHLVMAVRDTGSARDVIAEELTDMASADALASADSLS